MFTTNGWVGLYLGAIAINLLFGILRSPLPYFLDNPTTLTIAELTMSLLQVVLVSFLMSASYSKAILHFINTLFLDDKKFSCKLDYNSFFLLIISNMLVSVFTLGLYIPWAYKSVIDKLVGSIEYDEDGRFKFYSLASKLFIFFVVSIFIMILFSCILVFAIYLMTVNKNVFLFFLAFGLFLIFIVAFFSVIIMLTVFTLDWLINIGFSSSKKSCTYTLEINIASTIMFYIGQFILLTITFGLYSGAYLINLYEYFSSRIVEKQGDITTGRIVFRKPLDKGAGFLLLQVFLSFLTMNFYTPFAYVEYIKFFVNNTYLETKNDSVEVKSICSESSAE